MKKALSKSKTLLILSIVLIVALFSVVFTVSAFAADDVWTFTSDSVKDPLYVQKHFTELPRAFEAEVNFTKSYTSASPIIANWPNSDSRESFGFQITKDGKPCLYYYSTTYDTENAKVVPVKTQATFNYDVYEKGWVRLSVVNEFSDGKPVYKLYVNGVLTDTLTSFTTVHDIDAVASQTVTRELSIGNDGKNYFKGELRNVAVYKTLSADEAAKTAKENMTGGNANVMAYYDATMSGNASKFIKDQSGNGHDAYSAFFERKDTFDYDYSFAFVGDTQFLVEKDVNDGTTKYASPIFDWIVKNKDAKNIQRVFGLGDITDNNSDDEWKYAVTLYEKLGAAGVNYSLVSGNHDDYTTPAKKYNQYFGEVSSFVNSIDGYYEEGRIENFYTKFDVGTHKYMVIGLLYGAKDDVLAWANEVVAENSDRKVIVITHSLFDGAGNWAVADTSAQTTTSRKELNNGIDIWNEFISLHENIIIAAAGHISGDVIKAGKSVGVNGNVVNTFLIDPQGFDMATGYDTGLVAMFYFSEGGNTVNVEYVSTTKTLRAQDADPTADDILFHEKNTFSFKFNDVEGDETYTPYGNLPNSVVEANNFAVFEGGAFVCAHTTWKSATEAAASIFTDDGKKHVTILLLHDYTNTEDPLAGLAANAANGSLTIDLGGYTFTRSDTFLNLSSSSDLTNVAPANITVKNGTVRSESGKPIIDNQITNKDYPEEKVWNITFDGVTVGFTSGVSSTKGLIYQAWTNSVTADDAQLGTKVNIVFNGCTVDLKTDAPASGATLFALRDDHSGIDKIDVSVTVKGGEILANAGEIGSFTFYTLNEGSDSFTFATDAKGRYTKLITDSTPLDFAHYAGTFPTDKGERYFVETEDDGKESTYELKSLNVSYELLNGKTMTSAISLGTDNADAKYLSEVDYPFVLFDQTGKFYSGRSTFLNGAIDSAIYHIVNSNSKPSGKTAYVLMRTDYTMTSSEKQDNLSHGRESGIVIDMQGHSIIADASRTADIFNLTIKQWTGSKDGIASFATRYFIRNGTFKTHTARVLYYKSSNGSDISNKLMAVTLDNVNFELLSGATVNRFFHIAGASKTGESYTSAPVELTLNDCVFDFTKNMSSASTFSAIRCNFGADTAKTIGTVKINGGKVLANSLDKIEVIYYVEGNGFSLTYGPGSDGSYFSVVLPSSADASSVIGMTCKADDGKTYTFDKVASGTYSLCIATPYGNAPMQYADTEQYPFFIFKSDGTFVGAYADWALDNSASALSSSKTAGYKVLLRRDFEHTKSQYNNLSHTKDVTIDLNGFTLKSSGVPFFIAQKKPQSGNEQNTKVTLINGTVIIGTRALIKMDTSASTTPDKYGFDFTFENITVKMTNDATTGAFICQNDFAAGDPTQYCNFTFNNCVFDLSNATKDMTLFDVSDERCKVTAIINGGKIVTSEHALTVWKNCDTNGTVTANTASTLTFAKNGAGLYTTITTPATVGTPIKTVNGGTHAFVKTATDGETNTYSLVSADLGGFSPKSSITLGSELVFNIYVPATSSLKAFTVDGVSYENLDTVTLDGKDYYRISIPLAAAEAARDIVLRATVTADGKDVNGTWTMSIPRYATKVIESGTVVEATLVCDVLAYIRAAYVYFGTPDLDAALASIDAILGSYNREFTKTEGNTNTESGLFGVVIALEEKPAVRFILPEGVTPLGYSFWAGNILLNYTTGTMVIDGVTYNYAEVSLYAYQLIREISYACGNESGRYHLNSYYDFVTTDEEYKDNANLITLVEKLYNYAKSAEAYRAAVTGN